MKIEKINNEIYLDGEKIKNNYLPTSEDFYDIVKFIVNEVANYMAEYLESFNIVTKKDENSYTIRIENIEIKSYKKDFLNLDKNLSIKEIIKSIKDLKGES